MPTNYLTQFATSGTANLPTESTWQNLTERATGFQTGLARSSYFNRLFAQGANAAYVLGQMVVDYASQDANLNGATLYTNFKAALNSYVSSGFLPLAGGTMTGNILSSASDLNIRKTIDTGRTIIRGGSDYNKGGSLYLVGKDYSGTLPVGGFELSTNDGSNAVSLKGYPNGTLTWGGTSVVLASGATMTGELIRNGMVARSGSASGSISICNGASAVDGGGVWTYGKDNASTGRVRLQGYYNSTNSYRYIDVRPESNEVVTNCSILPSANTFNLGANTSSGRWAKIYAVSGTIDTSDERVKSNITTIPDDVLDAWGDVNWAQFQFNDSIDEKGETAARLHTGLIAQRIDEAFLAHGVDARRYGLFCHDEWEGQKELRDADGGFILQEAREAGDLYSLRYTEALCMEAAFQRRRADRAEGRIADLERRLSEIEPLLARLENHA